MNHKPIDYSTWNFDGQGKNIIHLFSPVEKELWEVTLPYQDKRDDTGHAENVTYFALKLIEHLGGNREIIIPTAILHDIGWSQLTEEEHAQFYLPNYKEYEPALKKRHHEQGVKVANRLLEDIAYPEEHLFDILEIISQHDTRKGFISKEDGLVRDADKLWRYTLPHFKLGLRKRKNDPVYGHPKTFYEHVLKRSKQPGFFYSDAAKEIARIEIDHTVEEYNRGR